MSSSTQKRSDEMMSSQLDISLVQGDTIYTLYGQMGLLNEIRNIFFDVGFSLWETVIRKQKCVALTATKI